MGSIVLFATSDLIKKFLDIKNVWRHADAQTYSTHCIEYDIFIYAQSGLSCKSCMIVDQLYKKWNSPLQLQWNEEITMIHMAAMCAGQGNCVCVGAYAVVLMCIVCRQWSFSAQLFIWSFHRDMLHNITAKGYRIYSIWHLEMWCFLLLQRVKRASGWSLYAHRYVQAAHSQAKIWFIGETIRRLESR